MFGGSAETLLGLNGGKAGLAVALTLGVEGEQVGGGGTTSRCR